MTVRQRPGLGGGVYYEVPSGTRVSVLREDLIALQGASLRWAPSARGEVEELLAHAAPADDAEADLERRLGIALHQRDVWRDAHDQLAREVGPHGDRAQREIEHWRGRYNDLSNIVGAMHGGEL